MSKTRTPRKPGRLRNPDKLQRLSTVFPTKLRARLERECLRRGWTLAYGLRFVVKEWLEREA